jgi:hypothetical protein
MLQQVGRECVREWVWCTAEAALTVIAVERVTMTSLGLWGFVLEFDCGSSGNGMCTCGDLVCSLQSLIVVFVRRWDALCSRWSPWSLKCHGPSQGRSRWPDPLKRSLVHPPIKGHGSVPQQHNSRGMVLAGDCLPAA